MTGKEFNKIQEDISCEGFDYTFVHYSDYDDITDPEFHRLRKAFLEARSALATYVGHEE